MFKVEREKGVYDAETKLPFKGIDVYGPGYIDKENEVNRWVNKPCSAETWYLPEWVVSVWSEK